MDRFQERVGDAFHEQTCRFVPHLLDGLVDGGEWGIGEGRLRDVVESDHREVSRHGEAELAGDSDGGQCRDVVGGEDGAGRIGRLEELPSRPLGGFPGVTAHPDEAGVEIDAGPLQGASIALLAQTRRLQVAPAGDETDLPVTEPDQVLGRGKGALQVLRFDRDKVDAPAWGSTATTGAVLGTSTTVGVTRRVPSVRVPLRRER